jgi:hypothetical protein
MLVINVFHSGTGEREKNIIYFLPWNVYVDVLYLLLVLPGTFLCHLKNSTRGQTCPFVLSDVAEIEKVWML